VDLGGLRACAALVDRCITDLTHQLGATPAVMLTGGGAPSVAPLLHCHPEHHPDLVLQGLAVLS